RSAAVAEWPPDDDLVRLAHPLPRAQRHDVALRAGREDPAARAVEQLVGERRLEFAHALRERRDLVLELEDAADALEVEPFGGEPRDLAELGDIPHRVPPRLAGGALRTHEPQPVVLPERLRMHPAQLRRDRDREERTVLIHATHLPLRALASRSSRGFSGGIASANACNASIAGVGR